TLRSYEHEPAGAQGSSVKPDLDDEEHTDGAIKVSQLNLVDLAGLERSLFVLSQVIGKLSEGSREFLTRILKNSLSGNARSAVICKVTLVEREITKSTLEFASQDKNLAQHIQLNKVPDDKAFVRTLLALHCWGKTDIEVKMK
ncbi:Centromere protein E_ 312kDa, partial [Caligus rogercresseyi]